MEIKKQVVGLNNISVPWGIEKNSTDFLHKLSLFDGFLLKSLPKV